MKKILRIIALSLLLSGNAYANTKDVTNLKFKPSRYIGKVGPSYEVVNKSSGDPVIGTNSFKFVAIPFDCGNDGIYGDDCGALTTGTVSDDRKSKGYSHGDRVRSEIGTMHKTFKGSGKHWMTFSLFIPNDYASIAPSYTNFFQIYEMDHGPITMIKERNGSLMIELKISGKTIYERNILEISDIKGKWNHFVINVNYSKNKDKGYFNLWLNSEHVSAYKGQTYGGSPKGLFIKAGIYQNYISKYLISKGKNPNWIKGQEADGFPTQIIYMDNVFKLKKKKKLSKLITKVFKDEKVPPGFNLEKLNIKEIKNNNNLCKTNDKNFYCAIAVSNSNPTLKFAAEDPNQRQASIKAIRQCFKKYNDCKVIFLEKNN